MNSAIDQQLFARYGRLLVKHPLWFVALPLLICLGCIAGLTSLESTPDSRIFFSEDNPQLQALQDMEDTFSKSDNAFIAIAPGTGSVFNAETFKLIVELTEASWQVPYSNRVNSLSNLQYTRAEGDEIQVRDLIETGIDYTAEYIAGVEKYVLGKPSILDRTVSSDARVTAVNITVQKPQDDPQAVFIIIEHVRDLVADFEARYPDTTFYLTGGTAFDAAFTEVPAIDNRVLGPLMLVIIVVILGLSLRSFWFVAAAMLLIGLATGTMLGTTGWVGARMNAGTAGAPVIVLSLSVAYCVHILATVRQQMQAGLNQAEAIVESLRVNFSPVTITSITTAVGFLSLNFSDAPPFRQLGNMVALGVVATLILSVTFLPAVLCYVRLTVPAKRGFMSTVLTGLADFVVLRWRILLPVSGIVVVLLSLGSFRIVLDDNFIEYFDDRYRLRRDTDFIEKNLTGMNALEYPFPAALEGGVLEPEYLRDVVAFETWLRQQPGVTNTASIVEVLKGLNQSMNGDDPEYYVLPDSRELAAQLLLMYEMSLPYGLDLTHQIDISKSSSRVVALVQGASSADLRRLNAAAEDWLDSNVNADVRGSGLSLIFAHISGRNINSMLFGSLFALVFISFILIFALRSWRMGLLSLVPNLVPAAMALGIWGYSMGVAGLSVAVVVAITLGIVVDDTVHFLSKYLRAKREMGLPPPQAVRFAFSTVGVALWITSCTLMAGFAVLALSGFRVTAEMGLLSAVTVGLALVADFFLLPPLLLYFDNNFDKSQADI